MRVLLDRLKEITQRVRASTDPADAAALSEELGALAIDMATLGYERRSSYEEFAPLQLACDGAREAIAGLRARPIATAAAKLTVEGAQTATAPDPAVETVNVTSLRATDRHADDTATRHQLR
jgi:hypothetical protein